MKTKLVLILIVLSVLTGMSCSTSAETAPAPLEEVKGKAKVTYIANEGVLIEAGGKKVLIVYGAAHGYWFEREIKKRADVAWQDIRNFLPE